MKESDKIQGYVRIMSNGVEENMHHIFKSKYRILNHFGGDFNAYKNDNSTKYWLSKFKKQDEAWDMSIKEFKAEINRLICEIL